ncbi:c-type cytochrome [Pseudomonas viciae]|nr:c-type cytochrome [Pseudomonas viciae]
METYRSKRILALCLTALVGCTSTNEETAQETLPMSGIAMADQVCSLCHGLTGESVSPMFPKLAGQQKEYLQLQLKDFKNHVRSDKAGTKYMRGFTHLTEAQITELADYFASQRPMQAGTDVFDARGELIYGGGIPDSGVARCSSCHGTDGEGEGRVPRVAGQHAEYVIHQINVLQKTAQHALSDADAVAVARYLAGLGGQKQ